MTLEEMRVRKTQLRYTYAKIAELSGLPLGTVQKVLTGATASPRTSTMQALEAVLGGGENTRKTEKKADVGAARALRQPALSDRGRNETPKDGLYPYSQQAYYKEILMEPAPAYKASRGRTIFGNPRGEFTLRDYRALPDDQRVELIDGYFFVMEAPTTMHQELIMELSYRFKDYQRKKRPDCRVFPAPFDVQLDKDSYTMVQPDISIICDRSKIVRKGCFGPPDLIVEIVSDSTRAKDMYMKLAKYKEAGVREYWIVDPEKRKVLVYCYEDEDRIAVYGMDEKVPVGISGGDLEIDFAEIMEELQYLEPEENERNRQVSPDRIEPVENRSKPIKK